MCKPSVELVHCRVLLMHLVCQRAGCLGVQGQDHTVNLQAAMVTNIKV
jgi:hypothetical protein